MQRRSDRVSSVIHGPKRSLGTASYPRSMECHAHRELKEVLAKPARRMAPDEIQDRDDRRIGPHAQIVAASERRSRPGLARARAAAGDFGSREPDAATQKEPTCRLRIVVGGK